MLLLAIGAAVLAIIYGVVQTQRLMAASAGTEKMQEIASAIQEGANAYLKRQYTTIAIVGMILYAEPLEIWVFVGAAVIFAGNYLNILAETRKFRVV